jgi:hypothetical protein
MCISLTEMARTKAKHVVPSLRARARPRWFHGLSLQDLDHVLYLIDMGIDSTRASRAEEISCKSFVVGLDLPGSVLQVLSTSRLQARNTQDYARTGVSKRNQGLQVSIHLPSSSARAFANVMQSRCETAWLTTTTLSSRMLP